MHVHEKKFGDDKSLMPSKASDLELKMPNNGENGFAYEFEEILVAVQFESSFLKQDAERNQSFVMNFWRKQ